MIKKTIHALSLLLFILSVLSLNPVADFSHVFSGAELHVDFEEDIFES